MALRIGSKVRITTRYYPALHGLTGKIVPMPGGQGSTRNGTKMFKYVQLDGGQVIGLFTTEMERV